MDKGMYKIRVVMIRIQEPNHFSKIHAMVWFCEAKWQINHKQDYGRAWEYIE